MTFILGRKIGMTTIHDPKKGALNVTLLECPENTVELVRSEEKDGYKAIQLSIAKTKNKLFKKEFRLEGKDEASLKAGDKVTLESFGEIKKVKVSGTSKAKGFQGVVKRHGFAGGPASHGHRHSLRSPGSIGSAFPQHVMKGKRMGGRMGGERSSVKNLKVAQVDKERNILAVRGAVPGIPGSIVEIRSA